MSWSWIEDLGTHWRDKKYFGNWLFLNLYTNFMQLCENECSILKISRTLKRVSEWALYLLEEIILANFFSSCMKLFGVSIHYQRKKLLSVVILYSKALIPAWYLVHHIWGKNLPFTCSWRSIPMVMDIFILDSRCIQKKMIWSITRFQVTEIVKSHKIIVYWITIRTIDHW